MWFEQLLLLAQSEPLPLHSSLLEAAELRANKRDFRYRLEVMLLLWRYVSLQELDVVQIADLNPVQKVVLLIIGRFIIEDGIVLTLVPLERVLIAAALYQERILIWRLFSERNHVNRNSTEQDA